MELPLLLVGSNFSWKPISFPVNVLLSTFGIYDAKMTEYLCHFVLDFKHSFFIISVSGLFLCITGEIVRKCAMLTANTNFNHVVQTVKNSDHKLVTDGIYSVCRHPSYAGWFYYSIGTQVLITALL